MNGIKKFRIGLFEWEEWKPEIEMIHKKGKGLSREKGGHFRQYNFFEKIYGR